MLDGKQYNWATRIFSHPLFSQPPNGISSPKNNPHPSILANLKRPLKNITEFIFEVLWYLILIVMWIQPISSFTELVTYNPMQICSWIFSKHFQNNFLSDNCGRPLPYTNFHILRNGLGKRCFKSFTKFTGKQLWQSLF